MLAEITRGEDAVLLRILAMREKETVMDLVMEVVMMAMKDAKENFSVEAITVNSLVCTTTRKMTAVRNLPAPAAQKGKTRCPLARLIKTLFSKLN